MDSQEQSKIQHLITELINEYDDKNNISRIIDRNYLLRTLFIFRNEYLY